MSDFLSRAFAAARERVAQSSAAVPLAVLRERASAGEASFASALRAPGVTVIAEVKRASPSRGRLAAIDDPVALAGQYAAGGAGAVSVLTEPQWFSGSLEDLAAVAGGVALPALRKDFVCDPYQVWEAAAAGAAAVLLIVAGLDDNTLVSLQQVAAEAGLDTLVEVHDAEEAERAARAHGTAANGRDLVLGVNARNLRTLEVDLDTLSRVRAAVPESAVLVAESGVKTPEDVMLMRSLGAHAVLVGEALVTAPDAEAAVRKLADAGRAGGGVGLG